VSADGKRLVIVMRNSDPASEPGAIVFVADLEDKGKRLNNARRLTINSIYLNELTFHDNREGQHHH
jgi:hypothetical protein